MNFLKMSDEEKQIVIEDMIEEGDLIRKGCDFVEDMGGHYLHESQLDSYISDYLINKNKGK